jgi:hypothetical protein
MSHAEMLDIARQARHLVTKNDERRARKLPSKQLMIEPEQFLAFLRYCEREWIPVGERLPRHIEEVLGVIVAPAHIGVPFAHIVMWNERRQKWQLGGFDDDDIDVEVSHWMPVPPLPGDL